jgi:RNA polymerase sigma-70 factor (ECF subfamily)
VSESSLKQRQRDVYETHKHRTFALAFYMTGNEMEAEEVLENTFVRAFDAATEPDGCGVDVAMVDELRHRMPLDAVTAPALVMPGESLHGRNVKRTELEEALKDLPPNERIVFLLRDVEGYPPERVAELLDIPKPQLEKTLLSARIRMRQSLAGMLRKPQAA